MSLNFNEQLQTFFSVYDYILLKIVQIKTKTAVMNHAKKIVSYVLLPGSVFTIVSIWHLDIIRI